MRVGSRVAATAACGILLAELVSSAMAASPPSRRSRVFDHQPAVYGSRGTLDEAAAPGSRLPWPSVGTWLGNPLRPGPEIETVLSPPEPPGPPSAAPGLAPPGPAPGIPLPPRRPPALGGIAPFAIDSKSFAEGGNCFAQLRAAGTLFAPSTQRGGNPACGIDNPVQVSAISSGGSMISLPDKPVISCRMAVRFGEWLRSVAPTLGASRNAALSSITTGPGWDCRPRNRQAGARLSAHGNGDALDINTFFFANRARLPVQGHGRDPAFHSARMSACSYFTTVLGPGAAFHDSHLHLDIMRHGRDGSFRLCR